MSAARPSSFEQFSASLADPCMPGLTSPQRFAAVMQITIKELAAALGVNRSTLTVTPDAPKAQSKLRDMMRVLSAASAVNGDFEKVLFWFRNQAIADFGHETPMRLISAGKAQAVVDYVQSLEAGALG